MTELWEVLTRHLPQFASGLWVTIRVVAFSFVIAMVVGTFVAALRVQPIKWLQRVGGIYVETFRNIPLLVLLIISFAGVRRMGIDINRWVAGCGSLGLYTAAYVAEALRSGVFAVGKGQIEASLVPRLHVRGDPSEDRPSAGIQDRHPSARQPDHRHDQELRGHRSIADRLA